jgi:hypothetical protein
MYAYQSGQFGVCPCPLLVLSVLQMLDLTVARPPGQGMKVFPNSAGSLPPASMHGHLRLGVIGWNAEG